MYCCIPGSLQGLRYDKSWYTTKKLEYNGIRWKVLEFSKNYLYQRRQYVEYKGVQSEIKHTEYGVPQGSVLGPLLFIIYSNDLPHSLQHCETILFANDTTVYFTHANMQILYRSVNSDLTTLDDWFRANQLSVNPTKTKYIYIVCEKIQLNWRVFSLYKRWETWKGRIHNVSWPYMNVFLGKPIFGTARAKLSAVFMP